MIAHETPAAPDAGPNLLKISESDFCVEVRPACRFTLAGFLLRTNNEGRVTSVLRGLSGTKRESLILTLILKAFLR
jgi:hypothetical protein